MPELVLNFDNVDRNMATHVLDPNTARILQRVDTSMFPGRMVRGRGASATQVTPSSTTVSSAYVFRRGDCKRVLVDGSTAGTVRITPGAYNKCYGPLPEWTDHPTFGTVDPTNAGGGIFGTGISDPSWAYVRFYAATTGNTAPPNSGITVYPDGAFFGTTVPRVGINGAGAFIESIGEATAGATGGVDGYLLAERTGSVAYGWLGSVSGPWTFLSPGLPSYTITVYWTNVSQGSMIINLTQVNPGETIVVQLSNGGTILAL